MKKFIYSCIFAIFTLTAVMLTGGASLSASAALTGEAHAHTIRVGLVRAFENRTSIAIATTSIDVGHGRQDGTFELVRTLHSPSGFVIQAENGALAVRAGGQTVFTFTNGDSGQQVRASDGSPLSMGAYLYRGVIEFHLSNDLVSAINVLPLEEYLYGVVSIEMSPSFYTEAIRAQAVAARSFAVYTQHNSLYTNRGFDLCDRTCCQAYQGAGRETDVMVQAVRDTHGLVVFTEAGDTPAFTPFFSSSGGVTDSSENVWGGTLPHLRAIVDLYEQNPRIWSRTYTWAELTSAVQAQAPSANIGTVTGVSVTNQHLGRVQTLTFIGTNGQWAATQQTILSLFRHIDSPLYSRNFYIADSDGTISVAGGLSANEVPVINLHATGLNGARPAETIYVFDGVTTRRLTQTVTITGGAGITINGRGWGHGVGMSQHGANAMAQAGYDFREILKHYYTGIIIGEWLHY